MKTEIRSQKSEIRNQKSFLTFCILQSALCILTSSLSEGAGFFNPGTGNGLDALRFNPAQLAYPERPGFSCRILDLGIGFSNNSFSFSQYNRYTGAYLDRDAKQDILGSIPGSGLALRGQAEAAALEFGRGNFGASVRTVGSASCLVPEEIFDLALFGNALDRVYIADDAVAFGQAYMRAGASVGSALGSNFALGVGAYYLRGLGCAELRRADAFLATTPTAISSGGVVAYERASGGAGSAFDAGAAFWKNGWYASLSCLDIAGRINWTDGVEQAAYTFELDSGNAYDIKTKRLFTQSFETGQGQCFTTRLPLRLNLAGAKKFKKWLSAGVVVESRLWGETRLDNGWRTSAVAELAPLKRLPFELELGYGQPDGPCFGAGAGAILGRMTILTRFEYVGGLGMAAKGVRFGLGLSYARLYVEPDHRPYRIHYEGD
jgi:hypothetical protein